MSHDMFDFHDMFVYSSRRWRVPGVLRTGGIRLGSSIQ
jgi:hypothetical protein